MEISLRRELICSILWICLSVNCEKPFPLPNELLVEYKRWLTILSKETGLPIKRCNRCDHPYLPEVHHIRDQLYCYFGCREWMDRIQKRERDKRYRKKKKYKEKKSEQNQRYRDRCNGRLAKQEVSSPMQSPSMGWIRERVIEVIHRFFPNLSQASIDWIHKVIEEELEVKSYYYRD